MIPVRPLQPSVADFLFFDPRTRAGLQSPVPNDRARQKKAQKRTQKRAVAKTRRPSFGSPGGLSTANAAALAATAPPGKFYLPVGWQEITPVPHLLTVATVRELPNGRTFLGSVVVDRTCLGIKDGFAREIEPGQVGALLDQLAEMHGGLEEVDAPTALSTVFHAIDDAAKLGFAPHAEFPAAMFPRPEVLMATPYAGATRPIYVPGPYDDVRRIVTKLVAAVGPDGYELVEGGPEGDDEEGES